MSGPVQQNITHYRGSQFSRVQNLSGITASQISEAWFTIRKRPPAATILDDTDPDVVAQATLTGGGIAIVNSTTLSLEIARLGYAFDRVSYFYDFKIRDVSGKEWPLTWGTFQLKTDVTRST